MQGINPPAKPQSKNPAVIQNPMKLTAEQSVAVKAVLAAQIGKARMEKEAYKAALLIASPALAQKEGKYTGGLTKEAYNENKDDVELVELAKEHKAKAVEKAAPKPEKADKKKEDWMHLTGVIAEVHEMPFPSKAKGSTEPVTVTGHKGSLVFEKADGTTKKVTAQCFGNALKDYKAGSRVMFNGKFEHDTIQDKETGKDKRIETFRIMTVTPAKEKKVAGPEMGMQ
jgi:hypothetical protein